MCNKSHATRLSLLVSLPPSLSLSLSLSFSRPSLLSFSLSLLSHTLSLSHSLARFEKVAPGEVVLGAVESKVGVGK